MTKTICDNCKSIVTDQEYFSFPVWVAEGNGEYYEVIVDICDCCIQDVFNEMLKFAHKNNIEKAANKYLVSRLLKEK